MRPIDQTDLTLATGDCYPAALASILEIPLSAIPNFYSIHPAKKAGKAIDSWCFEKGIRRLPLWVYDPEADAEMNERIKDTYDFFLNRLHGMPYMGGGPSPEFGEKVHHATVWRDDKMIHDPHPKKRGLLRLHHVEFFFPADIGGSPCLQ